MHAAVTSNVDFFLAGSIRDDGPLPDVCTDVIQAKKLMRQKIKDVEVAVMVATALQSITPPQAAGYERGDNLLNMSRQAAGNAPARDSIATGNLLKARVKTVCVDINSATVTKLMDRGS
ncbi:MAG: hypothetical protein IME96_01575 [Proteobacteria bacterium]|nr:hypothetical protein [Pseudomonadota bacterium]